MDTFPAALSLLVGCMMLVAVVFFMIQVEVNTVKDFMLYCICVVIAMVVIILLTLFSSM